MMITRSRIALLLTATLLLACEEKKQPDPPKKDPPKVVKKDPPKVEPPKKDPLAEAQAEAERLGADAVVPRIDIAQIVASDIETAAKVPTKSTRPRIKGKTSEKATGNIAPSAANRVFRNFDGAMKKCYERALKRTPGLDGKVELAVYVSKDGSVRRVKAKGISLKDSSVRRCMETTAKRMKFPQPKGGLALVKKRYTFTPAL